METGTFSPSEQFPGPLRLPVSFWGLLERKELSLGYRKGDVGEPTKCTQTFATSLDHLLGRQSTLTKSF